jgi:hypothetical protein
LSSTTTNTEQKAVTKRLSDNSGDSGDMVNSIQEHDQMHLNLDIAIILLKEFNNFLYQGLKIGNLIIDSCISINSINIITEDNSFSVKDFINFKLESAASFIREYFLQPSSIFGVNESISEYSGTLMDPLSDNVNW